jgi:protein-disulfide isomerase
MTLHTLYPGVNPAHDHWRGSDGHDAVTLAVFGDYECPFTRGAWRSVDLAERRGTPFRFVFRHFPLAEIHPHAVAAAGAAEAAAEQGRFWEMHELLFGHQQSLEDEDLVGYAHTLELDLARFEVTWRGGEVAHHIAQDRAWGERSGVEGTPALFIDGQRYRGSYEPKVLQDALSRQR